MQLPGARSPLRGGAHLPRVQCTALCHVLLAPSLLWPEGAPWAQIVRHHEDSSLINFIRVDWATFRALLGHFDADWVAWLDGFTDATAAGWAPRHAGRAQGGLALTLA